MISTVVMFQAQNRETINSTWKVCCVFQDHYDDERNKTVFHNTTSDLQDQDHSVQDQDQDQDQDQNNKTKTKTKNKTTGSKQRH